MAPQRKRKRSAASCASTLTPSQFTESLSKMGIIGQQEEQEHPPNPTTITTATMPPSLLECTPGSLWMLHQCHAEFLNLIASSLASSLSSDETDETPQMMVIQEHHVESCLRQLNIDVPCITRPTTTNNNNKAPSATKRRKKKTTKVTAEMIAEQERLLSSSAQRLQSLHQQQKTATKQQLDVET